MLLLVCADNIVTLKLCIDFSFVILEKRCLFYI